jgi:hypothetical protein
MAASPPNRTHPWLLVLAWLVAALLVLAHARTARDYLAMSEALGLRGAAQPATPMRATYLAFYDAPAWVRLSLSLAEGEQLRLRHTTIDNAPQGRDVHWNSGWAWTIVGAGALRRAFTGEPLPLAIERATVWLPGAALLTLMAVFSAWAYRRMGVVAALFVVAFMALQENFLESFMPSYVDHHGLLTASVFGTVLGAVAMMRGDRAGAVFSALCGAFGLWVSAASVLPALAMVGLAGLITARRAAAPAALWREWGAIGAGASLAMYLLEYFPNPVGMRVEVNNPLYAMAWFAGAECIARSTEPARRSWQEWIWPALALAAVPTVMLVGRADVFALFDPFMARLHARYIHEFAPLAGAIAEMPPAKGFRLAVLEAVPLVAGLATLGVLRRRSPAELVMAVAVVAPLLAMGWWQRRWLLNASAASAVLALVVVQTWTRASSARLRGLAAGLAVALLFVPGAVGHYRSVVVTPVVVSGLDKAYPRARDIAAALRAQQPRGDIILLASPNASTLIGYYGRFGVIGTSYWENAEGMKAAARMFSALDDEEAHQLIRARGVTHVAIVDNQNFIAEFYDLVHPGEPIANAARTWSARLLFGAPPPAWLEEIAYAVPPDLAGPDATVRLFAVRR